MHDDRREGLHLLCCEHFTSPCARLLFPSLIHLTLYIFVKQNHAHIISFKESRFTQTN